MLSWQSSHSQNLIETRLRMDVAPLHRVISGWIGWVVKINYQSSYSQCSSYGHSRGSKKSLSSASFFAAVGSLSNKLKRRKTNWIWQQSKNIFWDPTQRMPPCPVALLALLRWWVEPFAFSLPESGFDQACSLLDQLALPRDCSRDHQRPEHSARLSFLPQITMIDIWPWVRSAPPAEHL